MDKSSFTELIKQSREENINRAFSVLYDELKRLAIGLKFQWQSDYTINATALVHEVYLKLVDQEQADIKSKGHFMALAAKAMRHILINYARSKKTQKRGKGEVQTDLEGKAEFLKLPDNTCDRLIALNEALEKLETLDARQSKVVEFRFFAGISVDDTAEALEISPATVKRDWNIAKVFLMQHIKRAG